jgi:hypothetical protein
MDSFENSIAKKYDPVEISTNSAQTLATALSYRVNYLCYEKYMKVDSKEDGIQVLVKIDEKRKLNQCSSQLSQSQSQNSSECSSQRINEKVIFKRLFIKILSKIKNKFKIGSALERTPRIGGEKREVGW